MTTRRRKLVGNSLALFANQVTQNATSLILSIAIARILGPYSLGQYTLAFTFYFIFMTMSSQGLKTLLTRELARRPENVQKCLVSGTLLQFIFSTTAYILLVVLVNLLPYRDATTLLCMIVGAALLPYGLSNVTEAIFQAQEKMHLITISTVPVYILRLIIMIAMLLNGYAIYYVGIVLVISETIILVVEWLFTQRFIKLDSLKPDYEFIRETAKASRTFIAIESISVLKVRMQVLILSLLAGETVVGLYSAAVQLLQPFQLISQSMAVASLPTMARSADATDPRLQKLAETVIAVLLVVAIPMVIGFMFIGADFMVFLYRDPSFDLAGAALSIAGLAMIPLSFTRALSYLLMARGFERINLRTLVINTVLGLVASVILISQFQMVGAALAALIVELSAAGQFAYAVKVRLFALRLWRVIRVPLLIGAIMVALFAGLQSLQLALLVTLLIAGAVYTVMAGLASVYLLELKDSIRRRLLRLRSGALSS